MPASSMITRLSARTVSAQSGRAWWVMPHASFASVSVVAWVCSRNWAAAAADGASPTTARPSATHASASTRIAVVFPAPAGANASCNLAPVWDIWRTKSACPGFSGTPSAALADRAAVTCAAGTGVPSARPARSTR